jgi:hypothetical protein
MSEEVLRLLLELQLLCQQPAGIACKVYSNEFQHRQWQQYEATNSTLEEKMMHGNNLPS